MGKKYQKNNKSVNEISVAEEAAQIVENPEIVEIPEDIYAEASDELLKKAMACSDEQPEKSEKLISSLKTMKEVQVAHTRLELEKKKSEAELEKIEFDKQCREEEIALRVEEVKSIKRNGFLNALLSIAGTVVSFICYGALMQRQNTFEAGGETITSASGKDISRHAFDFDRMFKKRS